MSDVTGQSLPKVTLESSDGSKVSLPQDLSGSVSVIYFYPKDDTPGCTIQACSYRDDISQFTEKGIRVYGVSADDLGSHKAFIEKFELNFPLLVDSENKLSEPLGVWGEQEWGGQKFMGLSRDTFLVDKEGVVRKVWRSVDPKTTVAETLSAAAELI